MRTWTIIVTFACWGIVETATAAPVPEALNPMMMRLAQPPEVKLHPRPPLTKEREKQIKSLIAKLADVNHPDVGYSQTYGGTAFLPVPGHVRMGSMTVTNHGLDESRALRDLVAIGPEALPFLLEALGDSTPTKLVLRHRGSGEVFREGATWFLNELKGNPLNPREAKLIDPDAKPLDTGEHVETYTVRIGDLCFVAIGQIVGRPYMAVRYQMTSCSVINSPVEDPKFRKRIRDIWSSDDPTRTVFESLCLDYRTTGIPKQPDGSGWNYGSQVPAGSNGAAFVLLPQGIRSHHRGTA